MFHGTVVGKGRGFLVWCLFTGCLLACPTSELVSFREPLGSESFAEEEVDPGRVHLDRACSEIDLGVDALQPREAEDDLLLPEPGDQQSYQMSVSSCLQFS